MADFSAKIALGKTLEEISEEMEAERKPIRERETSSPEEKKGGRRFKSQGDRRRTVAPPSPTGAEERREQTTTEGGRQTMMEKREHTPFGTTLYLARKYRQPEESGTPNEALKELESAIEAVEEKSRINLVWQLVPGVVKGEDQPDGLYAVAKAIKRTYLAVMAVTLRNALQRAPGLSLTELLRLGVAEIRGPEGRERVTYNLSIEKLREFAEYLRAENFIEAANGLLRKVRDAEERKAIAQVRREKTAQTPPPAEPPANAAETKRTGGRKTKVINPGDAPEKVTEAEEAA